jgi:hypothetical protein
VLHLHVFLKEEDRIDHASLQVSDLLRTIFRGLSGTSNVRVLHENSHSNSDRQADSPSAFRIIALHCASYCVRSAIVFLRGVKVEVEPAAFASSQIFANVLLTPFGVDDMMQFNPVKHGAKAAQVSCWVLAVTFAKLSRKIRVGRAPLRKFGEQTPITMLDPLLN